MACRGKALQWAALPLLLLASLVLQAGAAAVHRAKGVDATTARLLGQDAVISQAALPNSPRDSDPGAYFAPDAWHPVVHNMGQRRSSSRHGGSPAQDLFISGPRTFRAESGGKSEAENTPRPVVRESEVVITPRPAVRAALTPTPATVAAVAAVAAVSADRPQQRSPEVQDSIAALANQLLAATPELPVLDVRTPPRMKEQQALHEAATPNPAPKSTLKEMEETSWSLVATNNAPPRITTEQSIMKPITKVPPISRLSTTTPKTSTPQEIVISTRFPPRKPAVIVSSTTEANSITKKPIPVVEITSRKPTTTVAPSTKKGVVEVTTKKSSAPSASVVIKKHDDVTTTKKPTTILAYKRTSTPMAVTILKRTNNTTTTITATTPRRPVVSITEKIPTTSTKIQEPPKFAKIEKVPPTFAKIPDYTSTTKYEKVTTTSVKTPALATTSRFEVSTTAAPKTTEDITTIPPVTSTTKRTRRPTKKKNKNRRRRPAKPTTPKPEEALETKQGDENLTGLTKPNKPLTTRIYQFISRDVMPNFGMGIMGILGTAVLAGLLLLPIDGFARRSDVYKREEESDGLIPSVIQAVMTSLNLGEQRYHEEEQGPRRYRRQTDDQYNEVNSDGTEVAAQPFSLMRLMKQMLAIKLDIVSNMLRVASEALRNYAQHGPHLRPEDASSTTPAASNTEETTMVEVDTIKPQDSTQEAPATVTVTEKVVDDENEESNLVRRRTNL